MPRNGDDKPKLYERGDTIYTDNDHTVCGWVLDNALFIIFSAVALFALYKIIWG